MQTQVNSSKFSTQISLFKKMFSTHAKSLICRTETFCSIGGRNTRLKITERIYPSRSITFRISRENPLITHTHTQTILHFISTNRHGFHMLNYRGKASRPNESWSINQRNHRPFN